MKPVNGVEEAREIDLHEHIRGEKNKFI